MKDGCFFLSHNKLLMRIMLNKSNKFFLIVIIVICINSKSSFGNESYFDLSDKKIEIQTNFNGKEVIIFGLTEPQFDTIIIIKGPKKDAVVNKKERILGFWFNTKRVIYKDLPSIFFIASSSPINEILPKETIFRKALHFKEMAVNLITQRDFNFADQNKFKMWNKNMIQIKKTLNLYKEYNLKIVDNKLFQTKVFFPSNSAPGSYDVDIYQIQNKVIVSEKNKQIIIKKTGIGNKIFQFAHDQPSTYGILCILLATFAGLIGAAVFRRL